MLALDDIVALSLWFDAPRLDVLELLERGPGDLTLESIVEAAGRGAEPAGRACRLRQAAAGALLSARRLGMDVVAWGDARYPPLLAEIPGPPLALWLRGDAAVLALPSVAIVGSRAATPYGLETASRLAGDLAASGALVVSGMARGVDSAAHRGALESGGRTVAVLGCGVDVAYPPEHRDLAARIAGRGAVVSELPPGTPPRSFHFPARNRIISGLSLATVVVEAAARSGSLITAGCALEQGRAVLAVPGGVLSGRHRGCHALIRDGAAVVESADDVLAELRTSPLRLLRREGTAEAPEADPVLRVMAAGEAYDVGALERETGLAAPKLLSRLLDLELRGAVRRLDGARFVRARRTC